jgi:hypothetical protein
VHLGQFVEFDKHVGHWEQSSFRENEREDVIRET